VEPDSWLGEKEGEATVQERRKAGKGVNPSPW